MSAYSQHETLAAYLQDARLRQETAASLHFATHSPVRNFAREFVDEDGHVEGFEVVGLDDVRVPARRDKLLGLAAATERFRELRVVAGGTGHHHDFRRRRGERAFHGVHTSP